MIIVLIGYVSRAVVVALVAIVVVALDGTVAQGAPSFSPPNPAPGSSVTASDCGYPPGGSAAVAIIVDGAQVGTVGVAVDGAGCAQAAFTAPEAPGPHSVCFSTIDAVPAYSTCGDIEVSVAGAVSGASGEARPPARVDQPAGAGGGVSTGGQEGTTGGPEIPTPQATPPPPIEAPPPEGGREPPPVGDGSGVRSGAPAWLVYPALVVVGALLGMFMFALLTRALSRRRCARPPEIPTTHYPPGLGDRVTAWKNRELSDLDDFELGEYIYALELIRSGKWAEVVRDEWIEGGK